MRVIVEEHEGYWLATWEDKSGKFLATSKKSRDHAVFSLGLIIAGKSYMLGDLKKIADQTEVVSEKV